MGRHASDDRAIRMLGELMRGKALCRRTIDEKTNAGAVPRIASRGARTTREDSARPHQTLTRGRLQ